jgi:hypothetical protein
VWLAEKSNQKYGCTIEIVGVGKQRNEKHRATTTTTASNAEKLNVVDPQRSCYVPTSKSLSGCSYEEQRARAVSSPSSLSFARQQSHNTLGDSGINNNNNNQNKKLKRQSGSHFAER